MGWLTHSPENFANSAIVDPRVGKDVWGSETYKEKSSSKGLILTFTWLIITPFIEFLIIFASTLDKLKSKGDRENPSQMPLKRGKSCEQMLLMRICIIRGW